MNESQYALEKALAELVGGRTPRDQTFTILAAVRRSRAHAEARLPTAATGKPYRLLGAVLGVAATLALCCLLGNEQTPSFPELQIAVRSGALTQQSQGVTTRWGAGQSLSARPQVQDRWHADPVRDTLLELQPFGTLQLGAGTELEIEEMKWREFAVGFGSGSLTVAVVAGSLSWLAPDSRTGGAIGDRVAVHLNPAMDGGSHQQSSEELQRELVAAQAEIETLRAQAAGRSIEHDSRVAVEDPTTLLASSSRVDQARGIELLAARGTPHAIRQLLDLYLATDDAILIAMLEEALLASSHDITTTLFGAFHRADDPSRSSRFADMLLMLAAARPELTGAVQALFVDTLRAQDVDSLRRTAVRDALLHMGPGVIDPVAAILTDPATSDDAAAAAAWVLMQVDSEHGAAVHKQLSHSLDSVLEQLASSPLLEDQAKGMKKKLHRLAWVASNRPRAEHDQLVGLFVEALGRARNESEAMPIAWGIANVQGISPERTLVVADELLASMMRAMDRDVRQSHAWAIHLLASGYGDARVGPTFHAVRDRALALHKANNDPASGAALTWLLEQLEASERRARR